MTKPSEMQLRVKRLLRGEVRSEDIAQLFLFLRNRCDGRQSVQEVGDFGAHRDERNKGLVTQTAREWAITARYVLSKIDQRIDATRFPSNISDVLKASLRRSNADTLMQNAKMRRSDANALLPIIVRKLKKNDDGTVSAENIVRSKERRLLETLITSIRSFPAFTDQQLCEELFAALKSNGLISKEDLRLFDKVKPVIALFAITAMHNCKVMAENESPFPLLAGYSDLNLEVIATTSVTTPEKNLLFASGIFSTELKAEKYCHPDLLKQEKIWLAPLEINSSLQLDFIR